MAKVASVIDELFDREFFDAGELASH